MRSSLLWRPSIFPLPAFLRFLCPTFGLLPPFSRTKRVRPKGLSPPIHRASPSPLGPPYPLFLLTSFLTPSEAVYQLVNCAPIFYEPPGTAGLRNHPPQESFFSRISFFWLLLYLSFFFSLYMSLIPSKLIITSVPAEDTPLEEAFFLPFRVFFCPLLLRILPDRPFYTKATFQQLSVAAFFFSSR